MSGEMSNPNDVIEYLKWRKEHMGPKEGKTLKSGAIINVPDKSGDPEGGWKIEFIYPDDRSGLMMAKVTKEGVGEKNIPVTILEEVN